MLNLEKRKGIKRRQGGGTWIIFERSITTDHERLGYSSNAIVSLNASVVRGMQGTCESCWGMVPQIAAIGPCMNITVWQTLSPHVEQN